ncbi:MAG: hypothetical protein QF546_09780 [Alphaproteobacteria bacterium]|jgi:hypothetical protein|nr:hypothetical protein [Alphaproteobacteria bacterium]HJP20859.1 hypothetical protein [Alphaproteobacteria bacterium]
MFSELENGARIGLVAREVVDGGAGAMLVWEIGTEGVSAESLPFPGYAEARVDILWVAEEDLVVALGEAGEDLAAVVGRGVRSGDILSFVMRPLDELAELGFEGFFESLGLSYMGACR